MNFQDEPKDKMISKKLLILTLVSMLSCKEHFCGEIQLGNKFVVALEGSRSQIIYCTSDHYCCDAGLNAVPMGVTGYGFNEKWIIARTKTNEYWIIDKDFDDQIPLENTLKDHTIGNLNKEEFEKLKKEKRIEIALTNIE